MKSLSTLFFTYCFLFVSFTTNAQESFITKKQLPVSAQKLISTHFSDKIIDYIVADKELISTDYSVKFTDGSEIDFNSEGNWTEIDCKKNAIPSKIVKSSIANYVKEKFPNTHIVKIEKEIFNREEIKLSNGLELEFNSKGEFRNIN